jgi:hypothetical protein
MAAPRNRLPTDTVPLTQPAVLAPPKIDSGKTSGPRMIAWARDALPMDKQIRIGTMRMR